MQHDPRLWRTPFQVNAAPDVKSAFTVVVGCRARLTDALACKGSRCATYSLPLGCARLAAAGRHWLVRYAELARAESLPSLAEAVLGLWGGELP